MSGIGGIASLALGNPFPAIFEFGRKIIGGVVGFLSRLSPSQLALVVVTILGVGFHVFDMRALHKSERHDLATSRALGKEQSAHAADIARFKAVQVKAAEMNKVQVTKTEAKYKEQNDEASKYLTGRIELLRRQLRAHPGNDQGRAGGPSLSAPDAPAGTAGEARVCVSPEVILRGAENEERHDELITLIEKQMAVDPNAVH